MKIISAIILGTIVAMILVVLAAVFAQPARATEKPYGNQYTVQKTKSVTSVRTDNRQGQAQGQRQTQAATGGNSSAVGTGQGGTGNGGASSVHYSAERTVSGAYAPSILPTAPCSTAVGGGAQGTGFGLSLGGSGTNAECERQELAKTAWSLGDRATAEEILCDSQPYREARRRSGRPCAKVVVTEEEAKVYAGTDPVVRYRHGMPPLRE